jgi:hypothetical protein
MNEKKLAAYIDLHMKQIDDSMDVETFAKAVAIVLAAEFGYHNYYNFTQSLNAHLYGN